ATCRGKGCVRGAAGGSLVGVADPEQKVNKKPRDAPAKMRPAAISTVWWGASGPAQPRAPSGAPSREARASAPPSCRKRVDGVSLDQTPRARFGVGLAATGTSADAGGWRPSSSDRPPLRGRVQTDAR